MADIPSKKLQSYTCQIIVSTAGVVEKKRFRETALISQSLICKRISEVKSTFSVTLFLSSTHLYHFSGFVLVIAVILFWFLGFGCFACFICFVWSFHFAVSDFCTCR